MKLVKKEKLDNAKKKRLSVFNTSNKGVHAKLTDENTHLLQ